MFILLNYINEPICFGNFKLMRRMIVSTEQYWCKLNVGIGCLFGVLHATISCIYKITWVLFYSLIFHRLIRTKNHIWGQKVTRLTNAVNSIIQLCRTERMQNNTPNKLVLFTLSIILSMQFNRSTYNKRHCDKPNK